MNLDIRELTSSLSSYSSATNQAVNIMADAVRPIGYILLGLFFWFEMASWSQMVKSRGGSVNTEDLARSLNEIFICLNHDLCFISNL